jgi:hypothetical protein
LKAEDKEVDGPDLERQQRLQESELEKEDEEELPEIVADEQRDLVRTERGVLLRAVEAIMARDHVVVDMLNLPAHELRALECLKAAVDGRDAKLHMFVFASDRRDLLEQALAVLQPNLPYDDASYQLLVTRVGELRRTLTTLEDSEDELIDGSERAAVAKADGPPPDEVDPDAPKPASTLYGDETTEPAKPATTLGDPAEIAAAHEAAMPKPPPPPPAVEPDSEKKKPWWKRPFG